MCSTAGLNISQLLLMGDSCGHRTMDTGNYDQCLGGGFQHCIVTAAGTLVGLCVPATCGPADVTNASAPIFSDWINFQMPLLQQFVASGYYVSATCGDNAMPWSPIATCVCVLLAGIAALISAATAAAWWWPHLRGHNKDRTVYQFFVETFALQASVPALLKTHGSDRSGRLAALNGTRVLSMGWVILGHTIIFANYAPGLTNGKALIGPGAALSTAAFQIIPSAEFAVDTFFVLSGFLATYLFAKQARKICGRTAAAAVEAASADSSDKHAPSRGSINSSTRQPLLESTTVSVGGHAAAAVHTDAEGSSTDADRARFSCGRVTGKLAFAVVYSLVHRWLRIAPVLAVFIDFYAWVVPTLQSGPFWSAWGGYQDACSRFGWTQLVFLNTNIPGDENFDRQCVGWTWYLSNDMQLFLTVPVFALLYAWRPAAGWAAVVAGTIASLAGAAATTYKDDLVSAILTPTDIATPGDYQNLYYSKSWMRAPAYFVGVALSFVLLRREALDPTHGGSHAKAADGEPATSSPAPAGSTLGGIFKRALPLAIPLAAMGVLVYVQVGAYQDFNATWSDQPLFFYTWASRPMWSAALAGMLYACFTGRGWLIGDFLGHKAWEPMARLTFGAYLSHPLVMQYVYTTSRSLIYFSATNAAVNFLAFFVLAHAVSAVMFIALEYPLVGLERAVFRALGVSHR